MGADTCPPKRGVCSTTTATAIFGSCTGAKAMNQAVFTPVTPVSAVPVFPATVSPFRRAAVPVPSSTTFCIMPVRSCADCGDMTRWRDSGRCV